MSPRINTDATGASVLDCPLASPFDSRVIGVAMEEESDCILNNSCAWPTLITVVVSGWTGTAGGQDLSEFNGSWRVKEVGAAWYGNIASG